MPLVDSLSPRRRSEEGRCRNQIGTPLPARRERLAAGRERGRFMESPLSFFACIGTMNHPLTRPPGTLSPSEGERDGVRGRFMESSHGFPTAHSDHEPATDRSADSLVREFLGFDSCGHGCPRSVSWFMESPHSLLRTHWDHEPLRLTEARSGPRVCDPQLAGFMERTSAIPPEHSNRHSVQPSILTL